MGMIRLFLSIALILTPLLSNLSAQANSVNRFLNFLKKFTPKVKANAVEPTLPGVVPQVSRLLPKVTRELLKFVRPEEIERAENERLNYDQNIQTMISRMPQAGRNVSIDWALQDVKDQKREGACTAYALSSAVEAFFAIKYQTKISINAQEFWAVYKTPSIDTAINATSGQRSSLFADVKVSSANGAFKKGKKLKIEVGQRGVVDIKMEDVPQYLSDGYPILFVTVHNSRSFEKLSVKNIYIPAVSAKDETIGHVTVLSGISYGLRSPNDSWFHIRNSWGADWGKNGGALLNTEHCKINQCIFKAIKNVSVTSVI